MNREKFYKEESLQRATQKLSLPVDRYARPSDSDDAGRLKSSKPTQKIRQSGKDFLDQKRETRTR